MHEWPLAARRVRGSDGARPGGVPPENAHSDRVRTERVPAGRVPVVVDIGPLTREEIVAVARDGVPVSLSASAQQESRAGRRGIEALADDVVPHYGVSTGFGALATRHIPMGRRAALQRSLVRSHAGGSGAEGERAG